MAGDDRQDPAAGSRNEPAAPTGAVPPAANGPSQVTINISGSTVGAVSLGDNATTAGHVQVSGASLTAAPPVQNVQKTDHNELLTYTPRQYVMLRVAAAGAGGMAIVSLALWLPGARSSDLEVAMYSLLGVIVLGAAVAVFDLAVQVAKAPGRAPVVRSYSFERDLRYCVSYGILQASFQFQFRWTGLASVIVACLGGLIIAGILGRLKSPKNPPPLARRVSTRPRWKLRPRQRSES